MNKSIDAKGRGLGSSSILNTSIAGAQADEHGSHVVAKPASPPLTLAGWNFGQSSTALVFALHNSSGLYIQHDSMPNYQNSL